MVKFKAKIPYYKSQIATGYINIRTGECLFFHENGNYWTSKKYTPKAALKLIMDVDVTFRQNPAENK